MPRQSAARASDPGAASHVQDGQQLAAAKRLRLNRLRVLAGMCWSVPGRTAKSCLPARDPKMFSFFRFVCEATGGEVATPTAMVYGVGVVFGYVMCEADNL